MLAAIVHHYLIVSSYDRLNLRLVDMIYACYRFLYVVPVCRIYMCPTPRLCYRDTIRPYSCHTCIILKTSQASNKLDAGDMPPSIRLVLWDWSTDQLTTTSTFAQLEP